VFDLAGSFYLLGSLPGASHSRWMLALVDSVWAVAGMWMTVAGLMMYVGRIGNARASSARPSSGVGNPARVTNPPHKTTRRQRR
jgi:hypothetical protein